MSGSELLLSEIGGSDDEEDSGCGSCSVSIAVSGRSAIGEVAGFGDEDGDPRAGERSMSEAGVVWNGGTNEVDKLSKGEPKNGEDEGNTESDVGAGVTENGNSVSQKMTSREMETIPVSMS